MLPLQLCLLPRQHRQRIASLAFSHDARYLVTVGADRDKSTAIWRSCSGEWYDAELQVEMVNVRFIMDLVGHSIVIHRFHSVDTSC